MAVDGFGLCLHGLKRHAQFGFAPPAGKPLIQRSTDGFFQAGVQPAFQIPAVNRTCQNSRLASKHPSFQMPCRQRVSARKYSKPQPRGRKQRHRLAIAQGQLPTGRPYFLIQPRGGTLSLPSGPMKPATCEGVLRGNFARARCPSL